MTQSQNSPIDSLQEAIDHLKTIKDQQSEMLRLLNSYHEKLDKMFKQQRKSAGYMARQEIVTILEKLPPGRLEHFGYKVYSQCDEDGILAEIFRRIGLKQGLFFEIGVENGLESNSHYLLHQGWRGGWLEASNHFFQELVQRFQIPIRHKQLAAGFAYARPESLHSLMTDILAVINAKPGDIDFLSIDIDGMDIYLLEALSIRPKVIIIEYNSKFPPHVERKPTYEESYSWGYNDYMGSSLASMVKSAEQLSYKLVATNISGTNAFFVHQDYLNGEFSGPFTAEALYNPPRYYVYDHFKYGVGHPPGFYGNYLAQPKIILDKINPHQDLPTEF